MGCKSEIAAKSPINNIEFKTSINVILIAKYGEDMLGCYNQSNRYMVEHSSRLICYYNSSRGRTGYTVNYAEKTICK